MKSLILSPKPFRSTLFRWMVIVLLAALPSARALTPQVSKLHNRTGASNAGEKFGGAVAVSDAWVLIGVPDQQASGAVQVFSAQTGRFVRTLLPQAGDTAGAAFGTSVAVCGNRAVVGAPENDGDRGVAYVFDLSKGRQLFRLTSPVPVAGFRFGQAVAICADKIAVSETGFDTGKGAVHLFHSLTGAIDAPRLTALAGVAGDELGTSLAFSGGILLAGAPGDTSDAGAVLVFDTAATTGVTRFPFKKLVPGVRTGGDFFGESLSADGPHVLIGAKGDNAGRGAAYLFHYQNGVTQDDALELTKLTASDGLAGDAFGSSVALSGDLALVGAPDRAGTAGAAYLFEPGSGLELRRFAPSDGAAGDDFGQAVALCNTYGVVGAPADDDLGADSGSAYFYRPLAGPLPFLTLAKSRDFAPGLVDVDYGAFYHAAINAQGETVFGATLTGPGSNRNRDRGVWSDLSGVVSPLGKSRDLLSGLGGSFAGLSIGSVSLPRIEQDGLAVFVASLTGVGVNTTNNLAVLGHEGAALKSLIRTGDAVAELAGARLLTIPEVLQTRSPDPSRLVLPYTLNTKLGGATRTNDTGVLVVNADGTVADADAREGEVPSSLTDITYGQFFSRAMAGSDGGFYGYPAFQIPDGETVARPGLFANRPGNAEVLVRDQGDVPDTETEDTVTEIPDPEGTIQSFLGEVIDNNAWLLYRASLAGPGVTRNNNEGIWHENVNEKPLIRKGDTVKDLPSGVVVSRFLSFWPVDTELAIALVKLTGPGVKTTNDCALILAQDEIMAESKPGESETNVRRRLVLMREGDGVADWDGARIGVIQRVEVEPNTGRYLVLASLTGASSRNQALFVGNATAGNNIAGRAARLPQMRLRKGRRYDTGYSDATSIRSLSIEPRVDRTGAGAKGAGTVLSPSGEAVLCIEFENRAKELVTGLLAR
jgi:hypothetical protein